MTTTRSRSRNPYLSAEFQEFALGVVQKFGDEFEERCHSGDVTAQEVSERDFGRLVMEEIMKGWRVKVRVAIAMGVGRTMNADLVVAPEFSIPQQLVSAAVLSAIVARRQAFGFEICEEKAEQWWDNREPLLMKSVMQAMMLGQRRYRIGEIPAPWTDVPPWYGTAAKNLLSSDSLRNRTLARFEEAGYQVERKNEHFHMIIWQPST